MAIWTAVFGTPAMLAAWLLWRAWWRQAGPRLSATARVAAVAPTG
jgi:hypothetical protein